MSSRPKGHAVTSQGNDSFTHKVKTDYLRRRIIAEVAMHRVADLPVQTFQVIGFGEYGLPQRARDKPAFMVRRPP